MKDIKLEARRIICEHTEAMMKSVHCEPKDSEELYEIMTEECANILTMGLLSGEYTPMEYNALRNELADVLWNAFAKHINGIRVVFHVGRG